VVSFSPGHNGMVHRLALRHLSGPVAGHK
jgi:hypothetical protein